MCGEHCPGAWDLGYRVVLINDATAGFSEEDHNHTMRNFALYFGKVMDTDELLSLLSQKIGDPNQEVKMIYFLVTAQVQRGKMKEWLDLYEKHFLPAAKRHGQRLIGAWRTSVGTYDEVTDLYAFESFTEFERIRKAVCRP